MKTNYSPLIKRYLRIYKKDPKSKVFALLADLYRKQGDREKAFALCKKGIKEHPQFALGHIALGMILLEMGKLEMAAESLEKAIDLSPENIHAYKLLGQIWLKLKNPEKTLHAYKMVLFLDPGNEKVGNIIKKLEPTTATHYDKTGFAFKNLQEVAQHITIQPPEDPKKELPVLRPLPKIKSRKETAQFKARSAMIEALIYRKEFEKARQFLMEMRNIYTDLKWKAFIQRLENKIPSDNEEPPIPNLKTNTSYLGYTEVNNPQNTKKQTEQVQQRKNKIKKLRQLLTRVEQRQHIIINQP